MEMVNTGLQEPVFDNRNLNSEASVAQGLAMPMSDKKEQAEHEVSLELNLDPSTTRSQELIAEVPIDKAAIHESESENSERLITNSSDKQVENQESRDKVWRMIDGIASNTAIISNVAGGFLQLMNIPEKAKAVIAKFVDLVTNFSFIPYGLDGMKKAFFENKNPYMLLGFAMELSMVWMSDLKNKYLIRGAATGTDQIWVATKHKLMDKDAERFQDGKFKTWRDGLIETPKACLEMMKDIFTNPGKALATIDKERGTGGYYALLSSIGSASSTIGYFLTRNEKLFGTIRDISGCLFDWEMLLAKTLTEKFSGVCFIAESVLDFAAKFIDDNDTRLFVNMLSHASGRQALQLYKASNETSISQRDNNQDKRQTTPFKGRSAKDSADTSLATVS
jgi:hypothetical protein